MKLSVSLPDADVRFLDEYSIAIDAESRSAVIHDAIDLLRQSHLESAYAQAFEEWADGEDGVLWEKAAADGLDDATR
jgi:Arc/MetJ-type ribon-helix-helix transcriptional regulator